MTPKRNLLYLLTLTTLFIFACSLPTAQTATEEPDAVFTAAAQTASVQLTQIAVDSPKTATPFSSVFLPTSTPLPTKIPATPTDDDCYKAKFITDVTVSDGTIFAPGEIFTKTWRVRNIGTCTWTADYALVFTSGETMGSVSPQLLMGSVAPNDTVDLSIDFSAPTTEGNYVSNWQIRNTAGELFAKIYVQIKVVSAGFAVTGVKDIQAFYISGHGADLSANIVVNRAGKVKYHWILRESGHSDLTTPTEEITFSAGGTQGVSTLWAACPHAGNFKASLYIDDPNHQEFGTANFTCP